MCPRWAHPPSSSSSPYNEPRKWIKRNAWRCLIISFWLLLGCYLSYSSRPFSLSFGLTFHASTPRFFTETLGWVFFVPLEDDWGVCGKSVATKHSSGGIWHSRKSSPIGDESKHIKKFKAMLKAFSLFRVVQREKAKSGIKFKYIMHACWSGGRRGERAWTYDKKCCSQFFSLLFFSCLSASCNGGHRRR